MRKLLAGLLALMVVPVGGQQALWIYSYPFTASLSGSAMVITLQQPASGAHDIQGRGFWIQNDTATACAVELEKNGTAATATDATASIQKDNDFNPASTAKVFTSSNVGNGANSYPYTIPASGMLSVGLEDMYLLGSGTSKNISLRTASCTVDLKGAIIWREF